VTTVKKCGIVGEKMLNINVKGRKVQIDDDLSDLFYDHDWDVDADGVFCEFAGTKTYLHDLILHSANGCHVIHRNGNKLNNLRENLTIQHD
jgi:hypothetical protein